MVKALQGFLLTVLLVTAGGCGWASPPHCATPCPRVMASPSVHTQQLPDGTALTWIDVPAQSGYRVVATLPAQGLQPVSKAHTLSPTAGVWAAINGGFFDPANGLTTSHVKPLTGATVTPQDNPRLWDNPKLAPYLLAIANRSEFRTLHCGSDVRYQIARHDAPLPSNCNPVTTLGAGPQLLPTYQPEAEAFVDPAAGRDPIGVNRPDARSAVGLRADGSVVLVIAAQTVDPAGTVQGGMSLPQLGQWLKAHGAISALNLDGGSSTSLWSQTGGEVLGKRNRQGEPVQRSVLSQLQVLPNKP